MFSLDLLLWMVAETGTGGIGRSGIPCRLSFDGRDGSEAVVAFVPEDAAEKEVPAETADSLRTELELRDCTAEGDLSWGIGGR